MEIIIFIVFIVIILSKMGKSKPNLSKSKAYKPTRVTKNRVSPDLAARLNAGQRAAQTGSATATKYQQIQKKRRAQELAANSGLQRSKDRQDNNRNRRTDWGSRGDSALFSPKMIGVIGGGLITVYFALTALNF